MLTGYTAKLMDKGETFRTFVLRCLRAMSCCATLRDTDMDEPIPEEFAVSNYHAEALAKAVDELNELINRTDEQKVAIGLEKIRGRQDLDKKMYDDAVAENKRLEDMVVQITNWTPGEKYQSFKEFMLDQLNKSKHDFRYYNYPPKDMEPKKKDPMEEYNILVENAKSNVKYHSEQLEKEREYCKKSNEYIAGIRKALEGFE